MSFFRKPIVAIDLNPVSIKAMGLTSIGQTWRVDFLEQQLLPEEIFEGSVVKNQTLLTQSIVQLFSSLNMKAFKVSLALPDTATISKMIQVSERLNEEEIEALIGIDFDKYIPYPFEEVNFDFQILGPSSIKRGLVDVLLVATRQENVTSRVRAFEQANIQVEFIEVESIIFERVLKKLLQPALRVESQQVTMILDMSAFSFKYYVFEGLDMVYTKEEEFDTHQLINSDLVATQINRTIQRFFSVSNYSQINQLYLAGEVATLPGLVKLVTAKTALSTQLANPFVQMEFARQQDKDKLVTQAPAWLTACGLAMQGASMSLPFSIF
jgi:type IV pilus assembly protein PilM